MRRFWLGALVALLGLAAPPDPARGEQDDKVTFRYKFAAGEKFAVRVNYSINVKFDEVPEAFQGVLTEEPVSMKFEGEIAAEVKEVGTDGKASVEGSWRRMSAKGVMVLSEIDFEYDAEKKGDEKAKKDESPDPGFGGFGNIEDQLRLFASRPLKMTLDGRGQVSVKEVGKSTMAGMGSQLISLNGLMGVFPESGLAKGETWKGQEALPLPGALSGTVTIQVKSENTYTGNEKLGDREVAVITSTFKVATAEGKKKDDPAQSLGLKMKTTGEGEGKAYYDLKENRPAKTANALKVRLEATIPNPGGGDDIQLKATLKTNQTYEVGAK